MFNEDVTESTFFKMNPYSVYIYVYSYIGYVGGPQKLVAPEYISPNVSDEVVPLSPVPQKNSFKLSNSESKDTLTATSLSRWFNLS